MADTTLYDTTAPTDGSLALAHQRIIRVKRNGVFENVTGDVNNLALNPTPITVPREVYGTKGRDSTEIIGYNFGPTFAVEAVRDPATKQIIVSQPWLAELIRKGYAEGADNRIEAQIFDAFDENLPAFQGQFSVAVAEANTGYADKMVYSFTLTNFGVVDQITSPIVSDGKPVLESALPGGQAAGDQVAVRGYKLTGATGVDFGATAADDFIVVDDQTIVAVIPTGVSGATTITVTNAAGASETLNYTAA
ncbi:IPT/TIG domain-containing protein [Paramicrobacterium chengjingii]|uniref:IPT/TIG domain-containing protein n=1 Tax=Paramicrobacterium chengjingii TaxID=2769067 RepID=A0ABX6YLI6_9MICO|nr:IPT/TIG domain-containing protein [Microbacterium chengjingii]QPZ39699.1 hypothetical protein HCR76_06545 [Microbacterium chengjingii]